MKETEIPSKQYKQKRKLKTISKTARGTEKEACTFQRQYGIGKITMHGETRFE